MKMEVYGHACIVRILARHPAGTMDIEVLDCDTCAGLIGRCYRVSGLGVQS